MAKGRGHFIFYKGMLSWGGPVFVTITLWDWRDKYGWHIPRWQDLPSISLYVTFNLALWLTAGYFFGARVWRKMILEEATTKHPNS